MKKRIGFRSRHLNEGLVIEKQYQVDDDSRLSRLTNAAHVQVKTAAVVQNGEIVDSQGEVISSVDDDQVNAVHKCPLKVSKCSVKLQQSVI